MATTSRERLDELSVLEWAMREGASDPRHAQVALEVLAAAERARLTAEREAATKATAAKRWGYAKHLAVVAIHVIVIVLI